MMKIIWCGNKPWDTNYPEMPLPDNAVELKRPENIFIASLPYGIVPLLLCFCIILLKWHILDSKAMNPLFVPLGIILGLVLTPVHELLHAICYQKKHTVYVGISLEKFAAFAVCHEAISKIRFIIMSLMPMLLGLIPLLIFLVAPPSPVLSGICIPAGIFGMLTPMPDYMDIHLILKQVPKGAMIQTQNNGFYWYQ